MTTTEKMIEVGTEFRNKTGVAFVVTSIELDYQCGEAPRGDYVYAREVKRAKTRLFPVADVRKWLARG